MVGYIGIYNTTGEDFVIGKIRIGSFNIEKVGLDELYGRHFEKYIENTEYLNEIVPARGFFVISYMHNYKYGDETILFELLSQDKKKRYTLDLFFSEEKETYHESYKITYRFAGMSDYSIIPVPHLAHLCDRLVVISDQISGKLSSICKIF